MFTTQKISKNGFEIIELRNTSNDNCAEVIPACGGILHAFSVVQNGQCINVVDGYDSQKDFEENLAAKGFKSCKLSPFACRIKGATYQFEENSYVLDKFVPGGNALHGLLYDAPFEVIYQFANDEHAGLALQYKYRGQYKGYPFHYDCVVSYHLKKNNELQVSTDIFNRGEGLMPIQDGWHPYFTLNKKIDNLELQFKSNEKLLFDDNMVPTGRIEPFEGFSAFKKIGNSSFDDCYTVNHSGKAPLIALRDIEQQLQVELWPDKSYPYLQVYTPPHRMSIALENLSAPPDTFNNGINLTILPPGANAVFNTMYKIVHL